MNNLGEYKRGYALLYWAIQFSLFVLLFYFLLFENLVDSVYPSNEGTLLTSASSIMLLNFLVFRFWEGRVISFDWADLLLFAFLIYRILNILFNVQSYLVSESFLTFVSLIPIYVVFKHYFRYSPKNFQIGLVLVFVLFFGIESIYGLQQLFGFERSNNSRFLITGNFLNPGPFAGFIATCLPLSIAMFLLIDFNSPKLRLYFVHYVKSGRLHNDLGKFYFRHSVYEV